MRLFGPLRNGMTEDLAQNLAEHVGLAPSEPFQRLVVDRRDKRRVDLVDGNLRVRREEVEAPAVIAPCARGEIAEVGDPEIVPGQAAEGAGFRGAALPGFERALDLRAFSEESRRAEGCSGKIDRASRGTVIAAHLSMPVAEDLEAPDAYAGHVRRPGPLRGRLRGWFLKPVQPLIDPSSVPAQRAVHVDREHREHRADPPEPVHPELDVAGRFRLGEHALPVDIEPDGHNATSPCGPGWPGSKRDARKC